MQKKYQKIIILSMTLFLFCSFFVTAHAQNNSTYTVLAPLPNIGDTGNHQISTDLGPYLRNVFNFAIGLAIVLAFVMITFGGFTYATSDAITGKSQGREWIENAIWGLLLVIGAWAILYTINPQILNFNLLIPSPTTTTSTPGATAGIAMTSAQITESNKIATLLGQTSNPCAQGQTTGCVNFNGLQPSTIASLQNLSTSCNGCTIAITGGTEPGHSLGSDHNLGIAVDIRTDSKLNSVVSSGSALTPCAIFNYNGGRYLWEPYGSNCGGTVSSTGDHWHVSFK